MPYLKRGRKKEIMVDRKNANTDGDFNYLYSREYLKYFIANVSYAAIARIAKSAIKPQKIEGVEQLEDLLTFLGVPEIDRQVARMLAYLEFYERVGRLYEDHCIAVNGDLEEYEEAQRAIIRKFGDLEKTS